MMFFALSGLINGLSATLLGAFVLARRPESSLHRIYALFCFAISVWSYSYFQWLTAHDANSAVFWARALMAGAIFIPITAFHHLVKLINKKVSLRFIEGNYVFSALLFLMSFSPWVVRDVTQKGIFPFWPNPGPLFHVHFLQFAVLALWGLWIIWRQLKHAYGLRLNQLKLLFVAEIVGWGGGFTNYLLWYDFPVAPYGNILVSVYTLIFAYAMVRYRLLDIEIVLKKSLIYALLLLLLLLPCYFAVLWGQQAAFGTVNYTFSLFTLLLFIMVGFLFPKLRFRTKEALERVLFQKRIDYRETLVRSSKDMVSIVDLENLSNSLVKTVSRALGTETASLYLLDEAKGVYNLKANIGREKELYPKALPLRSDPLIQRLKGSQEGIVREELEMARDEMSGLQVAEKMSELEAEISVPITSKEKLIGILNLGHKERKEIYSNEDLELLSTLANQAAIAIENARLYENLKQSQDTLRRADRLSSLGLLTAGLAHEIRNPLVAIRTFTQLLPERYDDAEFREGFQGLALKEVDRICGLINDLLSFARPSRPNVAEESMNDVVDGIARILETEAKEKGVGITRDFALNLPRVWIDREQMKQVFMNLILNAIQAMGEGGLISIATRLTSRNDPGHTGEFLQVEIRDTGVGIPPENLDHIFDPFFTSKEEGSGLGLSISHQIVQEHGGYVTVESKVGVGTTFFINLPIGKPIRRLSNGHAHANQANLSH
jgi:two-component system, NtrC family, sensor kinase